MFDVYLITPERAPAEILSKSEALLAAAPPTRVGLQLRAPHLEATELAVLARALRRLTRQHGAVFLLNGPLGLARDVGADGVQLKERGPSVAEARTELGADALVGVSRHDFEGLQHGETAGASFATLSPVFAVPGKGQPLGIAGFGAIAQRTSVPVFALGGITATTAAQAVGAGAHGIAAIRELFDAKHPEQALHALFAAIDAARKAR